MSASMMAKASAILDGIVDGLREPDEMFCPFCDHGDASAIEIEGVFVHDPGCVIVAAIRWTIDYNTDDIPF